MNGASGNGRIATAVGAGSLRYALVTAARDEEKLIERTLGSVVAQTVLPVRWVIVSDASTDGTDRIVAEYARAHPWIELLRIEAPEGRSFARKARAFNAGVERLAAIGSELVGNVDADLSFDPDYFSFLLARFGEMPDLGVAGTAFIDEAVRYDYDFTGLDHVSGGCQLFRRQCLDEVGGYLPIANGGIDWIAVTTARMRGWRTQTFVQKAFVHHRRMGSADAGPWKQWYRRGRKDHAMGGHPIWEVARGAYQSTSRPYVIGGLALLAGYAHASLTRAERPASRDLVRFHRSEQMARLRAAVADFLPSGPAESGHETSDDSLGEAIGSLERWVEGHDYKGYEPFDGLSSSVRPLTFGSPFFERLLQQVGRQSPFNLRPMLGIEPLESTKGRGCMASGYLARWKVTGEERHRQKAVACLDWLMRNKSPRYADYSWGNHFDYASRAGRYAKDESIIVWTAQIGQTFLDAYEALGEERYLDVARSVSAWILALPREETATGACLSYLAARQLSIHNSNLLGAAMLARTARHTGAAELLEVARSAVLYSCSRQRPDGAWYYGEDPTYGWIDLFHTGYDLDALHCYLACTGEESFRPHLDAGYRFFKANFIHADGRPKYYHDRTYPIDIQCAVQAIETLSTFADRDPQALATARAVARWTIAHMRDPSGYFYYRRYPFVVARIPMLHWGQATMYRALALLSAKLASAGRADGERPRRDAERSETSATDLPRRPPHISVCLCTYKRREMLLELLTALATQDTAGGFTHSVIVADNDGAESARTIVAEFAATSPVAVEYRVEPRRNIALARNKTVENARGDYIAFIDDDEVPAPDWLGRLLAAIERHRADGVLGPVIPRFAVPPPGWIVRGRFFDRPSPPSGTWLRWKQTRTGNALVRREIFDDPANHFRAECGSGGEDVDFFRRMIDRGMRFVWSADAVVQETVPEERSHLTYLLRRALLRGRAPHNQGWPVALSVIAVPIYAAALPLSLLLGRHVFVRYLIKECDHLGRIGAFVVRQVGRAIGSGASTRPSDAAAE